MHLHGVVDDAAVAAGHRQRHRDAPCARGGEDAAVALGQAFGREREAAEAVAFVRVGAGQVEDQAGRRAASRGPFGQADEAS